MRGSTPLGATITIKAKRYLRFFCFSLVESRRSRTGFERVRWTNDARCPGVIGLLKTTIIAHNSCCRPERLPLGLPLENVMLKQHNFFLFKKTYASVAYIFFLATKRKRTPLAFCRYFSMVTFIFFLRQWESKPSGFDGFPENRKIFRVWLPLGLPLENVMLKQHNFFLFKLVLFDKLY